MKKKMEKNMKHEMEIVDFIVSVSQVGEAGA